LNFSLSSETVKTLNSKSICLDLFWFPLDSYFLVLVKINLPLWLNSYVMNHCQLLELTGR
jgi:hypothetical protein